MGEYAHMDKEPNAEQFNTSIEAITPGEYEELVSELAQLQVQLAAALEQGLAEDVIAGIRERMADVEGYIAEYKSTVPQEEPAVQPPSSEPSLQQELDLVVDRMEMDEGRFTGPGNDSPAYLRKE